MKVFIAISRLLVGVLLIISGLIKANDALGFSYKLDEYFQVFGMPFLSSVSYPMAVGICILEIILGVATLIAYRMKIVTTLMLLLMVFFTFLTFYSAYFDVVKDCGCFGDALKLTPWESFGKDIALLILIVPMYLNRSKIRNLISQSSGNWVMAVVLIMCFWFSYHTYAHLPVKDFRPYAVGNDILKGMEIPEGAPIDSVVMIFKYKKDGQDFEFTMGDFPKNIGDYEFVDRIDKVVKEGYVPPIHDFTMVDEDGIDQHEEILTESGYKFLLIAYDLEKTNVKAQARLSDFSVAAEKDGIKFYGMTGTTMENADNFRHENNIMFPYFNCDATTLKTIVRANPGLVLLKDASIVAKWHHNDVPSYDEVKSMYISK
ncbi:MAG: DoxX family protein [Bacteroidia bacterium]|nr:DoxX family protein [Bacteroidia bacterium]